MVPSPPVETQARKSAFDVGDYGFGFCANSLKLGCDCLGHIKYFDGVVNDAQVRCNAVAVQAGRTNRTLAGGTRCTDMCASRGVCCGSHICFFNPSVRVQPSDLYCYAHCLPVLLCSLSSCVVMPTIFLSYAGPARRDQERHLYASLTCLSMACPTEPRHAQLRCSGPPG